MHRGKIVAGMIIRAAVEAICVSRKVRPPGPFGLGAIAREVSGPQTLRPLFAKIAKRAVQLPDGSNT